MQNKPIAESIFEEFCLANNIKFERIEEDNKPTPDYKVVLYQKNVYVEVKQIDKDEEFNIKNENCILLGSRTIGEHIKKKIDQARKRKQSKFAAKNGFPFILLVYNNLDTKQIFGTEPHDFISAMYGLPTAIFNKSENKVIGSFHGKNKSFEQDRNASFSAIGQLLKTKEGVFIRIYENAFAKNKLDYSMIPECISVIRIEIERI